MDNIQRIEGKTVKSIEKNSDSTNSFIIIKFEDDSKINITAYPQGDKGVGQLSAKTNNIKYDEIVGKRIANVIEKFDGETNYIIISFKEGGNLILSAFCNNEDITAGLKMFVYSSDKVVKESINENTYPRTGEYTMSRPQYENTTDETEDEEDAEIDDYFTHANTANNDKKTELISNNLIKLVFEELEEWVEEQRFLNKEDEINGIEEWLKFYEDFDYDFKINLIKLVQQHYNIHPDILN